MENFILGLAAVALAGMCGVAWKQPDFYNKYILKCVIWGALVVQGLWQTWNYSASFALKTASKLTPELKGVDLTKSLDYAQIPSGWWLGLIFFAVYGILLHLLAGAVIDHGMKSER